MVRRVALVLCLIALGALLLGCGAPASTGVPRPTSLPSATGQAQPPTLSSLFDPHGSTALPTVTRLPTATTPPRTPDPGAAGLPASTATLPRGQEARIVEWVIYDEILASDWYTDASWDVQVDLADPSHVYSGTVAMAVTPLQDYGAILLALKPDAQTSFPVTDVFGVSLWINGGEDILTPDDLAVTVVGSNDYTYWVRDDASVKIDDQTFFSESRLYYLGITRSLEPDTWAEAIVRLDQLPYDPNYRYVTGVYIKNDQGFRRTFYVDRIVLLLLSSPVQNTPTPTLTPYPATDTPASQPTAVVLTATIPTTPPTAVASTATNIPTTQPTAVMPTPTIAATTQPTVGGVTATAVATAPGKSGSRVPTRRPTPNPNTPGVEP